MSEKDFLFAKGNLAYSQNLRDQLNRPQMGGEMMPSMEQEQPQELPQEPEMAPEQPIEEEVVETPAEPQEEQGIVQKVVEAITPMFESLKEAFAAKKEEPTEAVLKVEGTLEPKEEEKEDEV